MRKICYLGSAISIHVQRWANYFVEHEWEVHIITKEPAKDGLHPNIKQHFSPAFFPQSIHKLNFPIHLHNINKLINLIKPDVVHAISIESYGAYTGFIKSKAVVLTGWGFKHTITSKGLQKWIEQRALKKADIVHVDSYDLKDAIVKYGCDENKVVVIPWGVNVNMFNPDINGSELRQKLELEGSPVVVSIRNFEPEYNIECLINAIPLVLNEISQAKFLILGSGSLKSKLKQMVKDLGVLNSVHFVGRSSYDKIPQYLKSADIYVSTSLLDSSSVSLQEAMACGLPVVVTDAPSNKEWIKDGWNGYVIQRKDSKALATKIIALLNDEKKQESFGIRNRELAEEKSDQEKCMLKMENLYKELVERYKS
jgi:glycosyltransferase involved in cell wall biosynthesis